MSLMHAFAQVAYTDGWTHAEILVLKTRLFFSYLHEASILHVEEQMSRIEASFLPHQKKELAQKVMNKYTAYLRSKSSIFVDTKKIEASWDKLRRGIVR